MADSSNQPALRKRQQISKANRMMFLWVMGASVVVGIGLVVSVFLVQKLIFNEEVLSAKSDTVESLEASNEAVGPLSEAVRVRNTDQALLDSRASSDEKPLQVVIDALPDESNIAALGSSLQRELLPSRNITIDSLKVESQSEDSGVEVEENTLPFSFTVTSDNGEIQSLKDVLTRLERSIRAVNVTGVSLEVRSNQASMTVQAVAYYEPKVTAELGKETKEPK